MSDVEVLLTVGKLDASLALLTTQDHHVIEFPTMLLPENVKAGSIVKIQVSQNYEEEQKQREQFASIQAKILEKYGTKKPQSPVLRVVNVTQTSCVLAWDPLLLGSAKLKSLVLYRQGVRSMVVPSPLKVTETKISGLSVGSNYEYQLKLSTTSGHFWSEKVKVTTHKMTDMSGITVCLGPLDPLQRITEGQIFNSLQHIGARALQKTVAIDTTHFVCNDIDNEDDPEFIRAKSSNIPIVRPEWVRACESEMRIVGVRGFYLDADPSILQSYTFPVTNDIVKEAVNDDKGILEEPVNKEETPKTEDASQDSSPAAPEGKLSQDLTNDPVEESIEEPIEELVEESILAQQEITEEADVTVPNPALDITEEGVDQGEVEEDVADDDDDNEETAEGNDTVSETATITESKTSISQNKKNKKNKKKKNKKQ